MPKAEGGPVRPYGVAISDALKDPKSTTASLKSLRDHAKRVLKEQGDLAGALKKLETEIAKRKK